MLVINNNNSNKFVFAKIKKNNFRIKSLKYSNINHEEVNRSKQ